MSITIEAIYENGVLRPKEPLELPQSAMVRVTIEHDGAPVGAAPPGIDVRSAAQRLAEIAALPMEPGGKSSRGGIMMKFCTGRRGRVDIRRQQRFVRARGADGRGARRGCRMGDQQPGAAADQRL